MTVYASIHFKVRELECSCGTCTFPGMDGEFMQLLERIRFDVNKPITLNSAYRCPEHNRNVSSTGSSGPHTTGKAVDIRCYGHFAHDVLEAAMLVGMTGIGVSQKGKHSSRFIHVDTLTDEPRPWVWSY